MRPEPSSALTIAIPFHRGHTYLREALDSVFAQTSADWLLLVCDDGPEAGTAELVHAYRDPRLSYHRNEGNLGMAGNWNRCLDLAVTDLVTLLHADDRLQPNYVALMTAAAAEYPRAAAYYCRSAIIDAAGRRCFSLPDYVKTFLTPGRSLVRLEGRTALEALLRGNFIMCPTVCYRKSVLAGRRFSTEWRQVQDLELFTRLLLEGEHLIGLPDVGYAYRRHADNSTSQNTRDLRRFREEADLYDRLATLTAARGWARAARRARAKSIIKLHLGYQIVRDILCLRLGSARDKLKFLRDLRSGTHLVARE
jgi:glycosyltransferase involved in cell wall biosynthesis